MAAFELYIRDERLHTLKLENVDTENLFDVLGTIDPGWDLDAYRDRIFSDNRLHRFRSIIEAASAEIQAKILNGITSSLNKSILPKWADALLKKKKEEEPMVAFLEELATICDIALEEKGEIRFYCD